MFKFFKEKILTFIYPNKCVLCDSIITEPEFVCNRCAKSVKIELSIKQLIAYSREKTAQCISPLKYKGNVKSAIWRFKFHGYRNYAEFFSKIIANEISKSVLNSDFDFISAVPLSNKRQSDRGYNQSRWLAEALSKKMNIPYKETLLKVVDNLPQHELPFNQRMQNIKGVYKLKDSENVRGKSILLCDDIITTGNTLKECVRVLKYGGAKSVVCCTIAYV